MSSGDPANPSNCAGATTYQPASSITAGLAGQKSNGAGGYYCQSAQPIWSARRDPSFGFGGLTFINDTAASFTWYRNRDQSVQGGALVPADHVVYVRG